VAAVLALVACLSIPSEAWPASAAPNAATLVLQTVLKPAICQTPALTQPIAIGLMAFNTPYLFGGRAQRIGLTCGACHGGGGPSGAAARLTFKQPVPDIALAASHGVDVAHFARHAVMAEFNGPVPDSDLLAGLGALAGVMAPKGAAATSACVVTAASLIGVELRLIQRQAGSADADRLDFMIDSTRFVLGAMAAERNPAALQAAIGQTNQALHAAEDAVDDGQRAKAAHGIAVASATWETIMADHHEQPFTLTAESGTGP